VQDADQHDADRLGQVEGPGRVGQDPAQFPEIGVDIVTRSLRAAREQCAGGAEDQRVVVDVDDVRFRYKSMGREALPMACLRCPRATPMLNA